MSNKSLQIEDPNKSEVKEDNNNTNLKCSFCDKPALFRCDKCQNFLSCSNPSIHALEWLNHTTTCFNLKRTKAFQLDDNEPDTVTTQINTINNQDKVLTSVDAQPQNKEINFSKEVSKFQKNLASISPRNTNKHPTLDSNYSYNSSFSPPVSANNNQEQSAIYLLINQQNLFAKHLRVIQYSPCFYNQRKEIFDLIHNQQFKDAAYKIDILIQHTVDNLINYVKQFQIIPFDGMEISIISTMNISDIINSYLYYEDYFSNLCLSITVYTLLSRKEKVRNLFLKLITDLQKYNIQKIMSLFIKNYSQIKPTTFEEKEQIDLYEKIFIRYMKMLLVICKYSNEFGEFHLFEQTLLYFIQQIQTIFQDDNYMMCNIYLELGNLYMKNGNIKKSHIVYETIITKNNLGTKIPEMFECLMCAYYNGGLIYFMIGNYEKAKQYIQEALLIKEEQMKEKYDETTANLYETLCEIDIEYKNYLSAYNNLNKAVEIKDSCIITNEDILNKKIDLCKTFLEGKILGQNTTIQGTVEEPGTKKTRDKEQIRNHKIKIDDVEDDKLIKKFIDNQKIEQNVNINEKIITRNEFKTFYLFISSLSESQVKKLNNDQPKEIEQNKKFPIIFSQEFKNSLNNKQRLQFNELKLNALIRNKILKNYQKKIKLKNLNYDIIYSSNFDKISNLEELNTEFKSKQILQNWEVAPGQESNFPNMIMKKGSVDMINEKFKKERDFKRKGTAKMHGTLYDFSTNKINAVKQKQFISAILGEEGNDVFVDFDVLKDILKYYCRNIRPELEKKITNEFVLLISRQMEKETLKKILTNPEVIPDIIEIYNEIHHQENEKENKQDNTKKDENND